MKSILAFFLLLTMSAAAQGVEFHITILTTSDLEKPIRGQSFAGIQTQIERPVHRAAELALFESKTIYDTFGVKPTLKALNLDSSVDYESQLATINPNSLVIVDTPEDAFIELATILNKLNVVTVNVRHSNPDLRENVCLGTLYHTIPSDRMYFDALVQFLIFSNWRKVLVVHGPSSIDQNRTKTLVESLSKFGADISDIREFSLSHHPDDRDKNKPEFLTGGASYDVVAVIDTSRDFGRYFQYKTRRPRPVVGDVGLIPRGWHRTLERYGAPQLNERYRVFDDTTVLPASEAMSDSEFATWSAIKLITNSLNTIGLNNGLLDVSAILKNPEAQVDLYKGTRGSIRGWNHQLRQPILLTTADAVIAVAPMPKFLHPRHFVDTLGLDEPESSCRLDRVE
ncbi:MAG: ABC transporter substrate binding protein (PQQ-dependent alcohol dehydrogenase system) [Granulosicoccus sp.]|jgi:ABC transporter substrate binding protein (PQQ-dependent alcohol dehydrogenase system)